MAEKNLKSVQKLTDKLFALLGFEIKAKVIEDKENQAFLVQIETEEPGILIGYHGETIEALQMILSLILNRQLGRWQRVLVNIGDYREKREETLKHMALSAAQRAHFSGQPVVLTALSAAERRIVHLILKDHQEVETFSEGEGRERRLIIKPR